jgi:hypothetical protein
LWSIDIEGFAATSIGCGFRLTPVRVSAHGHRQAVAIVNRFHLRGLANVAAEWLLVALAYNCGRVHRLQPN